MELPAQHEVQGGLPMSRERFKATAAAVAGSVLEWYDFAVFGYLAATMGKVFFPSKDEITNLLTGFAAFGVAFLVRPLGALVIGRLGDVKGRKFALMLTFTLMAVASVAIGLIPGYNSIGVWSPVLLVLLRVIQGFSAGAEWGGATAFITEWAPQNRRGLYAGYSQAGVIGGLLVGSAVVSVLTTVLSAEDFDTWGWRIAFLFGGLLFPVGLYIRSRIEETPAFRRQRADAEPVAVPSSVVRAMGLVVLATVSTYIVLTYMSTFMQKYASLSRPEALWVGTAGLLVTVVMLPVFGHLSDVVGRRKLLIASCVLFILLSYPLMTQMIGAPIGKVLAIQVALCALSSLYNGPYPATVSEQFSTAGRTLWMSLSYSLAVAIFGGFSPYIATWLISVTDSPLAPSIWLTAGAVISLVTLLSIPDTSRKTF